VLFWKLKFDMWWVAVWKKLWKPKWSVGWGANGMYVDGRPKASR